MEDIREVYQHGFGVAYASRWQKEAKAMRKMNGKRDAEKGLTEETPREVKGLFSMAKE
jgi:hypothetical protein